MMRAVSTARDKQKRVLATAAGTLFYYLYAKNVGAKGKRQSF